MAGTLPESLLVRFHLHGHWLAAMGESFCECNDDKASFCE